MNEYNEFIKKMSKKYFVNKKVLLIGIGDTYRSYTHLPDMFMDGGAKSCEYLEVHESYMRDVKIVGDKPFKITQGNVKDIATIFGEDSFDNVVWSHGPEHVTCSEFEPIYDRICEVARNLVFFVVPYGNFWDKTTDIHKNNNMYEVHKEKNILLDTYDGYNFSKQVIGEVDTIQGQLCLWKKMGESK
jgi:hypothetical protein